MLGRLDGILTHCLEIHHSILFCEMVTYVIIKFTNWYFFRAKSAMLELLSPVYCYTQGCIIFGEKIFYFIFYEKRFYMERSFRHTYIIFSICNIMGFFFLSYICEYLTFFSYILFIRNLNLVYMVLHWWVMWSHMYPILYTHTNLYTFFFHFFIWRLIIFLFSLSHTNNFYFYFWSFENRFNTSYQI